MARGTMHAPKPEGQRRRRNTPAVNEREIVDDGVLRGPELPAWQPWDAATEAWYETWRRSPQAQVFADTDWQRLHMLAPLVQQYWLSGGDAKLLAEIRQNEERLGATYTDRQRARMRIVSPALAGETQPGMASVTSIDAARHRWAADNDDD